MVYWFVKRAFDMAFSGTFLLVFSPLLLAVAILVRLDSPGPIFFRQKRIGRFDKPFEILKFRTMYVDAPTYGFKPGDSYDPRITRIGRILRRTSLDELPQFINILRGDMSLVGPRPEMPFIVGDYDYWKHRRHGVRPGLTGWWQVRARGLGPMYQNTKYDLYYVNNQSIWLDIKILCMTFWLVIKCTGAV
jgi:exopolysaccharide biosynthesis polyprenyl glycosylphosphotransferase